METTNNPRICTPQERDYVIDRDEHKCRYCGSNQQPFHIDHVYPYSFGGLTKVENLVTACQKCNSKKHNIIGIWPKPVGYFDKSPDIYFPIMSLIFTCSSMGTLYSSIYILANSPEFRLVGMLFGLIGLIFGLVAIGFITKGR